jgi:F-type H+-transporting ATPase subunit delta
MAHVDERSLALGRVYASAILDLAEEQEQGAAMLDELRGLAQLLAGDAELELFFSSPLVEEEAREEVIEKVFRGHASDLLVDALQVINRKGRLGQLRAIAEAYRLVYRDRHGRVDARVRTAVPLSAELRERLRAAVARFTGREPDLTEKVDASLLGGMIVEVAGKKIDTSVSSRLSQLGAAFDRRASEEIQRGSIALGE